jgi:NTP pyrophosphatase (non-canonical NTP hydrolase)
MNTPQLDLSFSELRTVNSERNVQWTGAAEPWAVADYVLEFVGEFGEACNVMKKLKRIASGMIGNTADEEEALRAQLADELGDAQICLDLLANAAGVDLGAATRVKFNKTSVKHGFPQRL